ncbi:MAG: nucleotide sugar dehydrogenase [Candidatus Aenigmarchaeota archaeon]|nr:nucleotide sugar dehydrogenase [Candidatus Aenigmarchaeota archaeon]
MRAVIIGSGYVGSVTGAGLASRGHDVVCTDVDTQKIDSWNGDVIPISEPGLSELVLKHRGKNLAFTTDLAGALKSAEFVFVCVNTPQKESGVNKGSFDMRYFDGSARTIAQYAGDGVIVVEKSTVPLRTAEYLTRVLESNMGGKRFAVVSNPEFLAEGTAVEDFLFPDRILVGAKSEDEWARRKMAELYSWVPKERIVYSNIWSAELAKLANNLSLSSRLTAMNGLAELCEVTGADINEVSGVVGMDKRIGASFLRAGIGFGGSCFRKDVSALVYLMEHYFGPDNPYSKLYSSMLELNDYLRVRFVKSMNYHLHSFGGKTIVLLGLAFKPDTDDVRDAPAVTIAKYLLEDGAQLRIVDPKAVKHAKGVFAAAGLESRIVESRIELFEKPDDKVFDGSEGIALVTEWKEFKNIDFAGAAKRMCKPAWFFDGRNMFDHEKITSAGLNYYGVGKGVFYA